MNYNDFKDDYSEEEDYVDREGELSFIYSLGRAFDGDAESQYLMGYIYSSEGYGVKVNEEKAEYWFKRASDVGHTNAQCSLADIYAKRGKFEEAFGLYLKAADGGNYYGATRAGVAYFEGQGVERNIAEAKRLLKEGAKGGYEEARRYLILCSQIGGEN